MLATIHMRYIRDQLSVLLILLIVLLVGCDSATDTPLLVDFWALGQEGEQVQALVAQFESRHPNIKIRVQQIPWSAAHEKLLTAYAGDALPDAFQLGNTWIPEFVALGALQALDKRLQQWLPVDRNDYFPGVLAATQLDGKTWAVPWYADTRLFFYRRDLLAAVGFDAVPTTWEEWLQAMARLKTLDEKERYAILLPINEWQLLVILALQRGATLLRDNNQYGDFESPAFREAFAFYLRFFDEELAPASGAAQIANLYQEFARGYFATYISGPWNIGELQRRMPASLQDVWMTAPLPDFAPTISSTTIAKIGVSLAGGASLVLSSRAKHAEAAWQWLEYLSEPQQQVRLYQLTGDLPVRRSAWRDASLAQNRYAQAFRQQLQHLQATPQVPEWERIAQRLAYYTELVVRQHMSVDAALSALNRETDRILEKRRWLLAHKVQP